MAAVQNHIHLDTVLGGSPENAPTLTYIITNREEISDGVVDLPRTLTGKLVKDVLKASGNPIIFTDFMYTLKIQDDNTYTRWQKRDFLKAMLLKDVYLVDTYHANNGDNHTADVKTMFFQKLGPFSPEDPALQYFLVDIYLVDDHTVV